MNTPAFSIILPTLGDPARLRRALASIRAQSLPDWECFVVLDQPAAANSVRSLAESLHDPRLQVLIHPAPRGVSAARNTAIRRAHAPLLALLDDDDFWTPDKLQHHLDAHRAHPDAALVYSDFIVWWQGNILPPCRHYAQSHTFRHSPSDGSLPDPTGIVTCGATFRRDACLECGGFDESFLSFEDMDFYLRLGRSAPFVHLALPLAFYTHSIQGSLSSSVDRNPGQAEALLQKHPLPPPLLRHFLRIPATSRTKTLIGILHRLGHPAVWREFVAFFRAYGFRHPVLLLKHLLICLLPFACYRQWYARNCRPEDVLLLRRTLDPL